MRRCGLMILLLIVVAGLLAESDFLWQENGIPLVSSHDIRWGGNAVNMPDGGTIVVWTEMVTDNHDIYGMRLDADGQMVWDEPHLFVDAELPVFDEKIALSSDGYIFLSWFTFGDSQLNLNKYDLEANQLWNECYSRESYQGYDGEQINRDMVPDQDGGVFLFWNLSSPCYAMHISESGIPLWDNELHLFEGYENSSIMFNILADDGQGGFIVGTRFYMGDGSYTSLLQRVLADGTSAWCNEIPSFNDAILRRTSDTEFAYLTVEYNDLQHVNLYRINLDGEFVNDEPLLIDDEITYNIVADLTSDADGNIFTGWTYRKNDEDGVSLAKITPDNEIAWQYAFIPENADYFNYMHVDLDSSGNTYQSWRGHSNGISILKLNPNGELSWSAHVADDTETYEEYVNLVMGVDDEEVSLFWGDVSESYESIKMQKYHADGTACFEENGSVLRQGWDCGLYNSTISESSPPQENFMYGWTNYYDDSGYIQTINLNGELGLENPGRVTLTGLEYDDDIISIYSVEDNYLITWTENENDRDYLKVNLFDQQGDRLWQEDLVVNESEFFVYTPVTVLHQGELLLYWIPYLSGWGNGLKAQRVIDGELAWASPVLIDNDLTSEVLRATGDYVVWNDGHCRTMRLDENGDPCPGWDINGNLLDTNANVDQFWSKNTDDGLIIVWRDMNSSESWTRLQILHEDATTEFEESLILFESTSTYLENVAITDCGVFTFDTDDEVLTARAFDFDGDSLWDSEVEICTDARSLYDIATTPDGVLLSYTIYYQEDHHTDLMLQHINFDGTIWNNPMLVCDKPGYSVNVQINPAPDNKYFITWLDSRDLLSQYFLFGQLLQFDPNATDDPTDIPAWTPNLSVYPNPFNPETTVQFSLPGDSKVDLRVYNVKGQLVRTLCNEVLPCGNHQIEWNGTDKSDKSVASGVYLINLNIDGKDYRSKALLLK